jgi:hypothetical protein
MDSFGRANMRGRVTAETEITGGIFSAVGRRAIMRAAASGANSIKVKAFGPVALCGDPRAKAGSGGGRKMIDREG